MSEIEDRWRWVARYRSDLESGNYQDEEERLQLAGGIDYETQMIVALADELTARERATRFGYRTNGAPAEPDLAARFAALRACGPEAFADLIGLETNQAGRNTGGRWRFRCPFHANGQERTPSLVVFANARAYCFACGWSGDEASFLAELRGIGPVEALCLLEAGLA